MKIAVLQQPLRGKKKGFWLWSGAFFCVARKLRGYMDTGIDVRKRLTELAEKAYRENHYVYTDFLNVSQLSEYYDILKTGKMDSNESVSAQETGSFGTIKGVDCIAYGGTPGCERRLVRFGSPEMFGYEESYPIVLLKIYPAMAKFAEELTHRDYLGSLIGLGLEREKLGDIIIKKERRDKAVFVFVLDTIADYVIQNLGYVKHTNVRVERCDDIPEDIKPQLEDRSIIVNSNRIDAIISKLFNMSREQALKCFAESKVFLNGVCLTSNAKPLKEKDVVSVRGKGKFIFDGEGGSTKKDKLYVKVRVYN
ncbi:MAG: hypothetical protein J5929_08255 [Eubacterium sp.]|nr:hypothetical protein [Eubacterium sp.]